MYVCVSVCVWNPASVCLCQTEANPFAPAGCSQSIEDDFSFFPMWSRLRRYLNIPTFSAARALLRALRGLFPLPPSPSLLASVSLSLSLSHFLPVQSRNTLFGMRTNSQTWRSASYFVIAELFHFRPNVSELCCIKQWRCTADVWHSWTIASAPTACFGKRLFFCCFF